MKIVKLARNFDDTHMVMKGEAGDFLPATITIHHNGREAEYKHV